MPQIASDAVLAERYRWFIAHGVFLPVLNDPKVIHGTATPAYVDRLIQDGIVEFNKGLSEPLLVA